MDHTRGKEDQRKEELPESHSREANGDVDIDVLGNSASGVGVRISSNDMNTSGSAVIDILTQSKDVSTSVRKEIVSEKEKRHRQEQAHPNQSDEVIDLDEAGLPNNLTSIHSEVTSPIGTTGKVFESSYLNVAGFESWRGAGTPPGTHMGPSCYDYDERKAFIQREASDETSPLNGLDAKDLYNSLESPQAPEALTIRLKETRKLFPTSCKVWSLIYASFLSNCVLFCIKVYIFWQSNSLAVLASAVDSFLDLVSQGIMFLVLRGSQDADEEIWPVGRGRLEPIGIIVCASLMGMASFQVIYQSATTLVSGYLDPENRKLVDLPMSMVIILIIAIAWKLLLFIACNSLKHISHSLTVLKEDHRNDVLSNFAVLAMTYTSVRYPRFWYLDPAGAILISLYICAVWLDVAKEQVR